jgi:hypothetical protein
VSRSISIVAILASALLAGCTAAALDRHTVDQTISSSDLRCQIVMDCLASAAANDGQIPAFSTVTDGLTQVVDTGKFESKVTLPSLGPTFTLTGTRAPEAQWTLDPAGTPEKLQAIQAACCWALYGRPTNVDVIDLLIKYKVYDSLDELPANWLGCGRKCDMPKTTCYTGNCCGTYLWVTFGGTCGLSEVTLILMDIATTDPTSIQVSATVTFTVPDDDIHRFYSPTGWYQGYPVAGAKKWDAATLSKKRVVQKTVSIEPGPVNKLKLKGIDLWDAGSIHVPESFAVSAVIDGAAVQSQSSQSSVPIYSKNLPEIKNFYQSH